MDSYLKKGGKIFDSHFHIYDKQFPISSNQGFIPEEFTCDDYKKQTQDMNIIGGTIVSSSFQRFDQTYLIAALKKMGPGFVGVTQLPVSTGNEELQRLHRAGIRGVRFNFRRGLSSNMDGLESFAKRIYERFKWHVELYIDSKELQGLFDQILRFPAVVVDHLGLSKTGFPVLLKLIEQGVKVKASGFGRVNFDSVEAIGKLMAIDPQSVIFGTDLPSTRAPRPFQKQDIETIAHTFDEQAACNILYKNALSFYHPHNDIDGITKSE
jgi:predicted TIM-barrel fold metal-dependent hydrolase